MIIKHPMLVEYEKLIASGKYIPDAHQEKVALQLAKIARQMESFYTKSIFSSLKPSARPKGVYLCGKVGRGKTWLMDLFFSTISLTGKKRVHFHAFMKTIHTSLKSLQGKKNPLDRIAKEMKKTVNLLCLDEFFVKDIADAMILYNLLAALYKNNISLVFTSNDVPESLYKNGLQREQFLPAISLIQKSMEILTLNTENDYRYRPSPYEHVFFYPPQEAVLQEIFLKFAGSPNTIRWNTRLYLYDKAIDVTASANNIVWFDFRKLCAVPRSQNDYLSIASKYKIIIIDNIDKIEENDFNTATYFIKLIDILYDAKNLLILSTAVEIKEIYASGKLYEEFQRTLSRLTEMQSISYIENTQEGALCKLKKM